MYSKNWDLTPLYSGIDDPLVELDLEKALKLAEEFEKKYRKNLETAKMVKDGLKDLEKILTMISKVRGYAYLLFSTDTQNGNYKQLLIKSEEFSTKIYEKTAFFELKLLKMEDDKFLEFLNSEELLEYKNYLKNLWREKSHKLSEREEILIEKKDLTGVDAFERLYSEITSDFTYTFEMDGEIKKLTGSEIRGLFYHPDEKVRERATITYYKKYEEFGKILNSIYNNIIKDHAMECEIRKYSDPMEPTHIANHIEKDTIDLMVDVITNSYSLVERYYRKKAELLGKKKLKGSDLYAPMGKELENIPYEEAAKMVIDAYGIFDEEFGNLAKNFFEKKWIDAEIKKGKMGGAYCYGISPEVNPFIMTNYNSKLRDVYTLAHEIGHGIHDIMASKNSYLNFHPPLVVAETASVFGEMLLTEKLKNETKMKDVLLNILSSKIEDIIATVYRQIMYILFEYRAHKRCQEGFLSEEDMCNIWWEEMERMYGDSIEFFEVQKWNWSSIPHFFHYRFYCYAYSFGELFVISLFKKYKEEGRENFIKNYKEILSSGGSKNPYQLAEIVGENLNERSFWEKGIKFIEEMIEEFERFN